MTAGSVFWRFLDINRDYLDVVTPVPGDFLAMQWIGKPIEILFVDLSKSWALAEYFEPLYLILAGPRSIGWSSRSPASCSSWTSRPCRCRRRIVCSSRPARRRNRRWRKWLKCCQAAVRIERDDLAGAEALIADVDISVRDAEEIAPAQEFARAIPANLAAVTAWLKKARRLAAA